MKVHAYATCIISDRAISVGYARTCRLIEQRCAWDDDSVSRLFIWRRNWAGWQFPSHSFDMWHDSEASSRCHIFNWLLRSSNQRPAINKNRIVSVIFVYHRCLCRITLCLPLRSSPNDCPLSFCAWAIHLATHTFAYTYNIHTYYFFLIKSVCWTRRMREIFQTKSRFIVLFCIQNIAKLKKNGNY